MPRAVLFDADQTLWDFQVVMRRALGQVLDDLRAALPGAAAADLTVEDLQADRTAVAEAMDGELNLRVLRRAGFRRTLARFGVDDSRLAGTLTEAYFAYRDAEPELFPDTVPTLSALAPHYRLGVLSNGSRLPERCGLAGHFEVVVFAQDHGAAKPDRQLFGRATDLLGLSPEDCVLVGDHPVNDVFGAKGAGWQAVWLDRAGAGWDPLRGRHRSAAGTGAVAPDAVIRTLLELPAVLDSL